MEQLELYNTQFLELQEHFIDWLLVLVYHFLPLTRTLTGKPEPPAL
ncbi:hypothetical protein CLV24_1526 [Pontibacter ummariensis]|uniref:Uncharacterized protein n=1 Tax=Pontibacter ummariensis TaxID=1610492 RepID=A0A239LWL8_9BACT|nr:hypothetical protein [Pontibacter ummariensis]PRY01038.1 hypothetical protein CLV24_1526 [Pontibacter ummariensis]SNT34014.1 hypothetical protein SAMN06296052_1524 [Pontibacter ummariensis]